MSLEMPSFKTATTSDEFLKVLADLDGYYECPKDASGKRLGPLVGYAGSYETDGENKHFVGDVYCNFAQMEQWPDALRMVAHRLWINIWNPSTEREVNTINLAPTLFVGMPMGGIMLAAHLGRESSVRTIFAEKKGDELVIARHGIAPDDQVVIVEDVCNNFSTTDKAVSLIEGAGAEVVAIACFLNRSDREEYIFLRERDRKIPVFSLVRKNITQYMQESRAVAEDVAAGNVVWKPKHDWARLKEAMAKAEVVSQATRALDKGCDPTEGGHCFM